LVEVHSAICRLHRDREISDLDKQGAVARLRLLNRGWREILPDDQVRDLATQLLDTHSLRAADSLQLAASLTWCEQRPSRRSFICGDQRLAKAAESAGFSVLELSSVVP
jgi:predicted nucleic acid-binding protein